MPGSSVATLPAVMEVWLYSIWSRKYVRSLVTHEMAACLESFALLTFQTLTGCDTMPTFVGLG